MVLARRSPLAAAAATGALLGATALFGCASPRLVAAPAAPLTPPAVLCTDAGSSQGCTSAAQVEAWLRDPRLIILGSGPTPGGSQGAKLFTLAVPHAGGQTVFRAKWRALSSESLTNEPRKEIGAYAVQKLFLEPYEYVVPPTAGHCFALEQYRALVDPGEVPSFEQQGVRCVFGILSYWLENVDDPKGARKAGLWTADDILDASLFEKNVAYRKSVADLNLVTYLIRHGDSHDGQFLITKDRRSRRVYSIDNSIAFQSIMDPMVLFRTDWSAIRVPAVSKQSIARLRGLGQNEWAALGDIEEYRVLDDLLVPTAPTGAIGPPDAGLRWIGIGLQISLTDSEICGVRDRLSDLVRDIDGANLRTF